MNSIGYFEIHSSDPSREIKFYESIFGWRFIKQRLLPIEYYRIETNTINGGLIQRQAEGPTVGFGTNAFVCSIQVADFDTTSELILKNGGQVALPKFAIPGRCWQGYFLDQDNNTFGLFQVDDNAK